MIKTLFIENLAVIERLSVDFKHGFTVLSGETGAGKSIIIDAINMVLGERSSRDIVREGTQSATVVASFSVSKSVRDYIENHDLFPVEDEIVFERKITADGKSAAKINARPANLATVKEIGALLLNIHGQHDSQKLLSPESHVEYLDLLAKSEALLYDYQLLYQRRGEILAQIKKLKMDEKEKSRRLELLRHQCDEIEAANLEINEEESLIERKTFILNGEKISNALQLSYSAINGDEEGCATNLLSIADRALSPVVTLSEDFERLHGELCDALYKLEDIGAELRSLQEQVSFDPRELEECEERLDLIYRLKRKYGDSIEEILKFHEKASSELNEIEFSDVRIKELEKELELLYNDLHEKGAKLTATRTATAKKTSVAITDELRFLNMPNATFQIKLSPLGGDIPFREDGMDIVEFLISTNSEGSLKPLHKIVSGGELSRICLAIKNVFGKNEQIDTLIFDEVDTGVSGRAAEKIGLKLLELSGEKQVLCVTHLSQIACLANNHLLIEKNSDKNGAKTTVYELDKDGRIMELARIISGEKVTDAALQSAKEMLNKG